jgi:hypothetical protein
MTGPNLTLAHVIILGHTVYTFFFRIYNEGIKEDTLRRVLQFLSGLIYMKMPRRSNYTTRLAKVFLRNCASCLGVDMMVKKSARLPSNRRRSDPRNPRNLAKD